MDGLTCLDAPDDKAKSVRSPEAEARDVGLDMLMRLCAGHARAIVGVGDGDE
jgi:hypothetical protein